MSRGGVDTLPVFPVELEPMARVRERLGLARRLDKLLLDNRYKKTKALKTNGSSSNFPIL